MVTCDLDREVSGEVLGWKLPAWKALLLHRVLPSIGGLVIYLTVICYDLALVFEHIKNGDKGLAVFCMLLFTIPSLLTLVFTLAAPPPGLKTELSAYSINVEKKDLRWIAIQFANAIFFPITAIGRYWCQIFWWVEAVFATRAGDEERTRDALSEARSPSSMELYLFLQAFVHCAPHAIVNVLDLMSRLSHSSFDKVSVQSVSIIASTLRMASAATVYRRFERERICGKTYPWSENNKEIDILVTDKVLSYKDSRNEDEHIYETVKRRSSISRISDSLDFDKVDRLNSDLIQFSPRSTVLAPEHHYSDSDISSDYLPPIRKKDSLLSSGFDSDSEYVRPLSIIDKTAPRRRDTEYTIEKVNLTPPPAMYAPRPGSIAVWAEKLMENAEAFPTWISAPTRRKYYEEIVKDEPDIPRRVPRSYMRGLEPQDATAALVHFLAWYGFFIARLLSIACFIIYFPVLAIIILFSHYQVMLLFLIVPQASTLRRCFYIFLAFIYLFCLMEFKVRFRHVRVWHVFWIIVCTIETVVFTGLWVSTAAGIDNWWKVYIVKVIMISLVLSYGCFSFYFIILKPRETIVYVKNKNESTK